MLVNQIAVFLENRKGRIRDFAKVLSDNSIDLVSMSIADTKEFGILRAITTDNETAVAKLKAAGFTVSSCDLIGIEVEDRPGGLASVLSLLDDAGVDIEYLYSYSRSEANKAIIMLKVDNYDLTLSVLKKNNITVIGKN